MLFAVFKLVSAFILMLGSGDVQSVTRGGDGNIGASEIISNGNRNIVNGVGKGRGGG